ncbi:MAG: PAS domain-containing protein [Chloroflexi bacterium]|nr:PAS domain-containing protein [Chloroflexota bacterium]
MRGPATVADVYESLNAAECGAYAVDMRQTIVFWNARAERILGYTAGQVIGRRCFHILGLRSSCEEGSNPVCMNGCPAIRQARTRCVPPAVRVHARCASGRRKRITLTPMVVSALHPDQAALLYLFHEGDAEPEDASVTGPAPTATSVERLADPPVGMAPSPSSEPAGPLTRRQVEVLRLLALGLSTKEIASQLHLSYHTVRNHISDARRRLHAQNILGAVQAAQRRRLL